LLASGFVQTNLVSDVPGLAQFTDPRLINPWGIAFSPGGPFWIADNGAGVSTLLNGAGQDPARLTVLVPGGGAWTGPAAGTPTGTVFNGGPGFQVAEGGRAGPGLFLFASEDGTISGWNPDVDLTQAIAAVQNAGAVYKGLALADNASGSFLFAANFRAGTIDVFDQDFHQVQLAGSFADPTLPAGFAPFNVQNIGGRLFVTYARQDAAGREEVTGPGQGFIDVFDTQGHLLGRLASQGDLNAPWGLAVAPANFGAFANALLVGNFGDGHITAFDLGSGASLGQLQDAAGQPLTIPNLWGLAFGNGGSTGDPGTLFFTAGIDGEQHGLFGAVLAPGHSAAPAPPAAGGQDGVTEVYGSGPRSPEAAARDDYPLTPADGPTFRGSVEGQPPPVPVLLPLRDPSPVAAPPSATFADQNHLAVTVSAGLPVNVAASRTETSSTPTLPWTGEVLALDSGTGSEPVAPPSRSRALDLLFELSAQADAAGESAATGKQVFSPLDDGSWSAAVIQMAGSESLLPEVIENPTAQPAAVDEPVEPRGGNRTPETAAAAAGAAAPEHRNSERNVEDRSLVNTLVALVLALGTPLAWYCRQTLGRKSRTEERRPRPFRSY
jgi:uncharacterized protein (TIGR03118 family)